MWIYPTVIRCEQASKWGGSNSVDAGMFSLQIHHVQVVAAMRCPCQYSGRWWFHSADVRRRGEPITDRQTAARPIRNRSWNHRQGFEYSFLLAFMLILIKWVNSRLTLILKNFNNSTLYIEHITEESKALLAYYEL